MSYCELTMTEQSTLHRSTDELSSQRKPRAGGVDQRSQIPERVSIHLRSLRSISVLFLGIGDE